MPTYTRETDLDYQLGGSTSLIEEETLILDYDPEQPGPSIGDSGELTAVLTTLGAGAIAGTGLYLALKHRSPWGLLLTAAGAGLGAKGYMSGSCPVGGQFLSRSSAEIGQLKGARKGVDVEESIVVDRPAAELYTFWRDLTNLPRIMKHLERVAVIDSTRSQWTATGPAGQSVQWEAEITQDIPGKMIAWCSVAGSTVDNQGSVRFRPASGNRGTILEVMLRYNPPGGKIGAAVAKLFHRDPSQQIKEDLRRFKSLMEAGDIATVAGQPVGTRASSI